MPIDYVSQTEKNIRVTFSGMPADTEVVFVNTTSGEKTPSGSSALNQGGDGTAEIPIAPQLAGGQYYLLAQNSVSKKYIAQTVGFYIN